MADKLNSKNPYFLRAFVDWMNDNSLTPHIVVNANWFGVKVPTQFVQDGQIILNISLTAIQNFYIDLDYLSFNARFNGVPHDIYIPIPAILTIYDRETGEGMSFQPETQENQAEQIQEKPKSKPSHLKIIK